MSRCRDATIDHYDIALVDPGSIVIGPADRGCFPAVGGPFNGVYLAMRACYMKIGRLAAMICAGVVVNSAQGLIPGAAPLHVTWRNIVDCTVIPPGSVVVTQSGVAVTVTTDATGFFLSVPSNATVGATGIITFTRP